MQRADGTSSPQRRCVPMTVSIGSRRTARSRKHADQVRYDNDASVARADERQDDGVQDLLDHAEGQRLMGLREFEADEIERQVPDARREGGRPVPARLRARFRKIQLVRADGDYAGRLVVWAADKLQLTLETVERDDDASGFVVLRDVGSWRGR
ncbi:hypothetical protein ACFWAN_16345 [Streptomyces mirabilis]|uniref:hypothetical protein n=1 Tax=Streptomyces mirabilis TaxID=68239 RepID=UPI0036506ACD